MKAMASRKRYQRLKNYIPRDMASPEALALLQWFEVYFATYPGHTEVDPEAFDFMIAARTAPDANPESVAALREYAKLLRRDYDEDSIEGALATLYDLDVAGRAGALLAAYNRGEEVDLASALAELSGAAKRAKTNSNAGEFETTGISQILAELADDSGIKFKSFGALRAGVRAMQDGASIAIAGRPDKGKTSCVARILVDFAPQCVEYFGAHRPILWLNNEGTAKRIIPRLYQAALNESLEGITKRSNAGTLEADYCAALGIPDLHHIRVKNIHGANLHQIEKIIEEMDPCVVVYDMLANVHAAVTDGGNKADAVEGAWQTVREFAVNYKHIAISTVQISDQGGNQLFPPYNFLKDSRTGIQGATDLIIMLGALDNPDLYRLRGISTPKNKFAVTGVPSYVQAQYDFDNDRCIFTETQSNAVLNEGPRLAGPQAQGAVPGVRGAEGGRDSLPGAVPAGDAGGQVPELRGETAAQPANLLAGIPATVPGLPQLPKF